MCLVVSEDGYIDLVPHLRPQLKKSDIDEHVALLKSQTQEDFHKTRNWLDEHRFYLTAEQCGEVNRELKRIDEELQKTGELRPMLPPFVPDPEMNESYYLN